MKKLIIVTAIFLLGSVLACAQGMRHRESDALKKIEELEKIKIIETLGMDETTTLKFFSRRTKFRDEQSQLFQNAAKLLDQMEETAKKTGDKNDPEMRKMIDNYFEIENEIVKDRETFINSLKDILSYKQISLYLVFEKKFREEIRNVLFKERMRGRR